jgi:hypothetical protein
VTPDNVDRALAAANDGDVIVLGPGVYDAVTLNGRRFEKPLVIDARRATLLDMQIKNSQGVTIRGGTFNTLPPDSGRKNGAGRVLTIRDSQRIVVNDANFVGPGATDGKPDGPYGDGVGVKMLHSDGVEVRNSQFTGLRVGVSVAESQNFIVSGNTFQWMRSDGIDVAKSRKGLVERNHCSHTRIYEKEHPDCVQLWSRPDVEPTSDVVIRGNHVEGPSQGIGAFNHVRKGVNDGGFDRILIEDNVIHVSRPNGITLVDARDSIIRNNHVSTDQGAKDQARIRASAGIKLCGNVTESGAGKPGKTDPKC